MHRFDYSFLKNGLLPANLVNTTMSIASLKTMESFRKESHLEIFTKLESIAKVQSVKSSPSRGLSLATRESRKL